MVETLRRLHKEMVFAKPTTARELLGVNFQEPEGLFLTTAPMQVLRKKHRDDSSEYGVIINYPLEKEGLVHFLQFISPGKKSFFTPDNIADHWKMPDRKTELDEKEERLHRISLGEEWEMFERHRQIFIDALGVDKENYARDFFKALAYSKTSYIRDNRLFNIVVTHLFDGKFTAELEHLLKVKAVKSTSLKPLSETLESIAGLIPVIRWTKNQGTRSLNFDLLEKQDFPVVDNGRPNTLAGFLTVLYFFNQVKKDWPKVLGFSDRGPKLPVGPIQIPVLALMRRGEILETPFFEKAEQHAEKATL